MSATLARQLIEARMAGGSREQWLTRFATAIDAHTRAMLVEHVKAFHGPVNAAADANPSEQDGERWYACGHSYRVYSSQYQDGVFYDSVRPLGVASTRPESDMESYLRYRAVYPDTARATIRSWQQKLIQYDAYGWPVLKKGWQVRSDDTRPFAAEDSTYSIFANSEKNARFSIDGIIWHPYTQREQPKPEPQPAPNPSRASRDVAMKADGQAQTRRAR